MKLFSTLALAAGLLFATTACDNNRGYYAAQAAPVAAPMPQMDQQTMLKGVIQDFLNQTSPGTQLVGANFLPMNNNLYIAQTHLMAGGLQVKKNFTVEAVGDPNMPQWQVEPTTDASLQNTLTRYGCYNEVSAIYMHPQYHTPSLLDAVLTYHYLYGRPSPLYWGAVPTYGYGAWGFAPSPVYRTRYTTVINQYPSTRMTTTVLPPKSGAIVVKSTTNYTRSSSGAVIPKQVTPAAQPQKQGGFWNRSTTPAPATTPQPQKQGGFWNRSTPPAPTTTPAPKPNNGGGFWSRPSAPSAAPSNSGGGFSRPSAPTSRPSAPAPSRPSGGFSSGSRRK